MFVDKHGDVRIGRVALGIVTAFTVLAFVFGGWYHVGITEEAVVYDTVNGDYYNQGPGTHFKRPIIDQVTLFDTSKQFYTHQAQGMTFDQQAVFVEVGIRFRVDPSEVTFIRKTLGGPEKFRPCMEPLVESTVKSVAAKYTQGQFAPEWGQIKNLISEPLTQRVPQECFLTIEAVDIRDFDFSEVVNKAIEEKQVAQQELERATFGYQRQVREAESRFKAAQLEANATIVRADAAKYEQITVAEAKAKAAEIVSVQLTSAFLEYYRLQMWGEGGAKVPQTLILGNTSSNFLYSLP